MNKNEAVKVMSHVLPGMQAEAAHLETMLHRKNGTR